MLTALRQEANAQLAQLAVGRKPALRRSDAPGFLLATDLPFAAEAEVVQAFTEALRKKGWRVEPAPNGWLLMDRPVPVPEGEFMPAEGECACCLSLLARHGADGELPAEVPAEMIREAVRAAEAGRQVFEHYCEGLHRCLAAMLRRGEALPAALTPYLTSAFHQLYDRRNEP